MDILATRLVSKMLKPHEHIPDEVIKANMTSEDDVWQMFFDGASRTGLTCKITAGVWVLFISHENHVLSRAFSLTEPYSNNVAEYIARPTNGGTVP